MWGFIGAIIAALARLLVFSKYRAGRKLGEKETRLEQAEQTNQALQAQAQAAADAAAVAADPHALAERVRREGF